MNEGNTSSAWFPVIWEGPTASLKAIARITGGQAVITTASDVQDRPAIDLIAQELGLEIENPEMLATVARCLLEDEPVWVYDPEHRLDIFPVRAKGMLSGARKGRRRRMLITRRVSAFGFRNTWRPNGSRCLLLRPRNLVVGLGCNRGTPVA